MPRITLLERIKQKLSIETTESDNAPFGKKKSKKTKEEMKKAQRLRRVNERLRRVNERLRKANKEKEAPN